MRRCRNHFINREMITLTIMSIVVILVMLFATAAWFMGPAPVSVKNLNLNMDDKGDLYVWIRVEEDIADEDMVMVCRRYNSSAGNINSGGNMATSGNLRRDAGNADDVNINSDGNADRNVNVHSEGQRIRNIVDEAGNVVTDEWLRDEHFLALQKVGTGNNVNYTIDMNIVAQDNIEENTLAPGAYGKVELKILSRTSLTKGYKIRITPYITINDSYDENTAHLTRDELFNLVKSHVKFYAVNENGHYSQVIPYYDENTEECYVTGDLEEDVMKSVELYWYWPYEYVNVPDKDNIDSPVYDDYEKYRNLGSVAEQIEEYDWDDTYIGNYVEEFKFHFDVDGNR